MRVILLGPPGGGKGTQGELIEKKYGFPKISTGDLLRREVQEKTTLGEMAKAEMNQGELVNDDIVIEMIKHKIFQPDCKRGYILDGFPRNVGQARRLEEIEEKRQEIVIDIHLSEQTLIQRLSERRICSSCGAIYNLLARNPRKEGTCDFCGSKLIQREDDVPEVIKERLKVYHEQTEALIDYYSRKKVYFRIDGEGKIETISKNIYSILDREIAKSRVMEAAR
ncbi:MAG: adenylate kinase [Candidatus Aminicenantes bacterium]|nr:MAG: adenylate kinase [Candidatus Aminicenantes bacterium]